MSDGILDEITEDHGYSVDEGVEPAHYMAGHVDRDSELILVRMGNDDGTILEATLLLEEAEGVVEALEGNISELVQVININGLETQDEIVEEIAVAVGGAVDEGDYPVMQLLVSWIEANGLWADFAKWASEVADLGAVTGTPDNG
jgi:hypothetical protein